MLNIQNLSKRFGGMDVISGLNLHVKAGRIHSIIGPNGAGKTTLFNLITGLYKPDSGDIRFEQTLLNPLKPHRIAKLGISRNFQNIRLFSHMTVEENLRMGQGTQISFGLSSLIPYLHGNKRQSLRANWKEYLTCCALSVSEICRRASSRTGSRNVWKSAGRFAPGPS